MNLDAKAWIIFIGLAALEVTTSRAAAVIHVNKQIHSPDKS
jgi:hypothetical protein